MKKFISGLIIGLMISVSVSFADSYNIVQNSFPIYVNGTQESVEAININGTTWIRLGSIAGVLGASATFDEVSKQINIIGGDRKLTEEEIKAADEAYATAEAEAEKRAAEKRAEKESKFYEKDGLNMVLIDGREYIYDMNPGVIVRSVNEECYVRVFDEAGSVGIELRKGDTVLIKSIEYTTLDDRICIEYTYYTDTILPLIQ